MERRTFISSLTLGLLAAPLAAEAQQAPKAPSRIGFIGNADPKTQAATVDAFRQGLREMGLVEGQNIRIEYRWAEGKADRFSVLAVEFVRLKPDVIIVSGIPSLRAIQKATSTIPIVAILLLDPVNAGFVASHARPGGNITGLASQYEEIVTKQVQLLADAVPRLSRVVLLDHTSASPAAATAAAAAADKLALTAQVLKVSEVAGFEAAFRTARDNRAQAMLVLPSPIFNAHRRSLIRLAASYRMPVFYELKTYVQDGGLMSYGPSIEDMFRRAASFAGRILNGANPADLPMERPTKYELVINLKTAKALGLTIPPSLLQRADQVIE